MKIKEISASECSGLSTRALSDIARNYDYLVVTWWGKPDLVILHADSELAKRLFDESQADCKDDE